MANSVPWRDDGVVGKYSLLAKLARGGMGEIYLAQLRGVAGFEKLVVIKRLLPHLAENKHFVAMLLDEARIAARLSHPNVCQVHELSQDEGEFFIVMEYLEGVSVLELLRHAAKSERPTELRMVSAIIGQACEGLHAAHEMRDASGRPTNLVHRDISPSNLFVTESGTVKVLDFGIAKTPDKLVNTRTGAVKGKWAYMSPEQVLRQPLDRRSDVFSLGIVLFEALSGRRLFRRRSEYETCRAITERDAPPVRKYRPDLPEQVAVVVARALSRPRQRRFTTAREFGRELTMASASFGGPMTNAEISEYVHANFAEELEQRRAFIKGVTAAQGGVVQSPLRMLPTAPHAASEAASDEGEIGVDGAFDDPSAAVEFGDVHRAGSGEPGVGFRAGAEGANTTIETTAPTMTGQMTGPERIPSVTGEGGPLAAMRPGTGRGRSPGLAESSRRLASPSVRASSRPPGQVAAPAADAISLPDAEGSLARDPSRDSVPLPTLKPRGRGGAVAVIFAVVAAAAAGAGAVVYMKSAGRSGPGPRVVVYEGGVDQGGGRSGPGEPAGDRASDGGEGEPGDGAGMSGSRTPGDASRADAGASASQRNPPRNPARDSARRRAGGGERDGAYYKRIMSRQQRRLQACMAEHAGDVEGIARIELALRIERSGRVSSVEVKPARLAGTGAASCMSKVASTLEFGKHEDPVAVDLGLNVRKSR